jgi:hypothetical protein
MSRFLKSCLLFLAGLLALTAIESNAVADHQITKPVSKAVQTASR